MNVMLSIEKKNDQNVIAFIVNKKSEVDQLTLEMMSAGFDVLYEPGVKVKEEGYESCIICGEETCIRILAPPRVHTL